MLAKSRVVYLFLYVKDLARSRDFYEHALGLRVIEEDRDSVKYDTGEIILGLNKAQDYGITLTTPPDHSTDIVFLVDDIDAMRAALEERGVVFSATSRYEVGAIADFYDPDGHWFTLYEPSEEAMAWPSGEKIRTVWNTNGRGASGQSVSSIVLGSPNGRDKRELRLDGKTLIYLFLFVLDANEAFKFYHDGLGLLDLEGGPCSRASSADEEGVIKYDGGGVMLTSHHIDEERTVVDVSEHACPPRRLDPEHMEGKAVVFHVTEIEHVVEGLSRRGIRFSDGLKRSRIGAIAKFKDPTGHTFYLYEPSAEALSWPSGAKLKQILAEQL